MKANTTLILVDSKYPDYLYATPEASGITIIESKEDIKKTLIGLRAICGYAFSLCDCIELKIVSKEKDHAIYQTNKTRIPIQIKIVRHNKTYIYKWL